MPAKKKRGRGRPAKAKAKRRTVRVSCALTNQEARRLEREAKKQGQTKGVFLRALILAGLDEIESEK